MSYTTQQALSAFDAAVAEVGVRNAKLASDLRGAFFRLLSEQASAPDGWQLVPVEPTIAMCIAGDEARSNVDDLTRTPAIYRAMLAAAPQPPAAEMLNGMAEDETAQTASVAGLTLGAQQCDLCQNCAPDGRCMKRQALCGVKLAAQQGEAVAPTRADLIAALKFYATGEHFILSDPAAWDTVSGEPQNWQCDEAGTATVEDGWIAQATLEGRISAEQIEALEDGETLEEATQPAAAPQPVAQSAQCRDDGRCQYAIDHGAEGLGHCPPSKCALPQAAAPAGMVGEPYCWVVSGLGRPFYGEHAEQDARDEARRAGGTAKVFPLYTTPPARQALTDEQIAKALAGAGLHPEDYREDGQIEPLVRAIERACAESWGVTLVGIGGKGGAA